MHDRPDALDWAVFMTDHYFNALEYAHRLEEAGVPTAQAEVHANTMALVLENCLSSAAEIGGLKSELLFKLSEVEVALRAEIKKVEVTLRAEIKEVEVTLRAEIKEVEVTLRAEIKEAEARVRTDLASRIDRLEANMQERFRWQWWANGVMVAMLVGLYFR
jgi:hypothetical protein